jgi:penicillin-binding protein 2
MQLGNRAFHCWKRGGHGAVDLRRGIAQSCDIYFYEMVRRVGYDAVAPIARALGLGQKFDLPFGTQRYGTVPDSAWKLKRYKAAWTVADSLNASIGQGYVLANPLQLAVMARASLGPALPPRLINNGPRRRPRPCSMSPSISRSSATACSAWSIRAAPAVRRASRSPASRWRPRPAPRRSAASPWRERGSGVLKQRLAAVQAARPRAVRLLRAGRQSRKYAAGIVLEHNGHTIRNLDTPMIGRDIMTYLFDRERAMKSLDRSRADLGWRLSDAGGNEQGKAFRAARSAPPPPRPRMPKRAQSNVASAAAAAATTSNATTSEAARPWAARRSTNDLQPGPPGIVPARSRSCRGGSSCW